MILSEKIFTTDFSQCLASVAPFVLDSFPLFFQFGRALGVVVVGGVACRNPYVPAEPGSRRWEWLCHSLQAVASEEGSALSPPRPAHLGVPREGRMPHGELQG